MLTEDSLKDTIVEMIRRAETSLPPDVINSLKRARNRERGQIAKFQFGQMFKNLDLAKKLGAPICQDTGTFTFFIKLGRKLRISFDIQKVIVRAVAKATREIPLRTNVVDPITRELAKSNTGKGQPAVHLEIAEGKDFQVDLLVKGAGTENYGRLFMMRPMDGLNAVEQIVLSLLKEVRGKPCPPNLIGVGVGGSMETAPLLAKLAMLRPLDLPNSDPELEKTERKIESAANSLNTGPMGLGGKTTVLKVLIEKAACHTASLPIAVAIQCWPARRAKARMIGGKLKVV